MKPHRPPAIRSVTSSRRAARCALAALVMLVAAFGLHALAPAAVAAKPGAKQDAGRSAAHARAHAAHARALAPGQAKKAAASKATATALAAVVAQAAERLAVAEPTAAPKAKATKTKTKTGTTTTAKRQTKTKDAAKSAQPAQAKPKKRSASSPPDPAPPVVAPAAVAAPVSPPVTAAPPPPAPPAAGTPQTARTGGSQPRRRARSGTAGTGARRPSRPPSADRPARVATALIATTRPRPEARQEGAAPEDEGAVESPLTRTVVRVLEVVPPELRIALGVLAGLGLLLGAAAAVQTVRRRRLERQRGRLLADVGVLQSALLPQLPERIGGARVSAAYRPADGLAAGGDFYDAFELPGGRTGVLVGDVAGHGREVVPLTALVRYNVRAYLEAGLSPRAAVHVAANVLVAHLGDLQVTIVVAIADPGTGRLTYACAGHPPPLLLGDTTAPVTACSSPPIGAGAPTGRRQTTIAFAPGAVACFHTDGLDEAPLTYGRLGRDGLADELQAVGPQADAGELIARVVRRSVRQPDDMAACVVTALPGGADGWSLRLEELEVDATTLSSGSAQRFLIACGVEHARIARALRAAHAIIGRDGTAVIEVRVGDTLADVRVTPPPAVTLPIAGRPVAPVGVAAATG